MAKGRPTKIIDGGKPQTKKAVRQRVTKEVQTAEIELAKQQAREVMEGQLLPGRPTNYSQDLVAKVCEGIISGKSLRTVCKAEEMPAISTVFKWLHEHPEFMKQYTLAQAERAEAFHEDILDIADDGTNDYMTIEKDGHEYTILNNEHINRSRLRVDTRKWLMERMKPKKYGAKLDVTSDGKQLPTPIFAGLSTQKGVTDGQTQEKPHNV